MSTTIDNNNYNNGHLKLIEFFTRILAKDLTDDLLDDAATLIQTTPDCIERLEKLRLQFQQSEARITKLLTWIHHHQLQQLLLQKQKQ